MTKARLHVPFNTFVLASLCALVAVPPAYAVVTDPVVHEVLTFEDVAPFGSGSPFIDDGIFVEGNYRVFTPHGQWVDSAFEDLGTAFPDNGTDWFLNNSTRSIEISHLHSSPIFLRSFDATEYARNQPGGSPIAVEGIRADGSTLFDSFLTQDRVAPNTPLFETFTLGDEWFIEPFSIIKIGAPSRGFAIDNIRLSAVIPEPNTFVLATLGLLGLLGFGRRRRRCNEDRWQ